MLVEFDIIEAVTSGMNVGRLKSGRTRRSYHMLVVCIALSHALDLFGMKRGQRAVLAYSQPTVCGCRMERVTMALSLS